MTVAPGWVQYGRGNRAQVMSLFPTGGSTLVPTGVIAVQHNCGFWDAVNRAAPWAP